VIGIGAGQISAAVWRGGVQVVFSVGGEFAVLERIHVPEGMSPGDARWVTAGSATSSPSAASAPRMAHSSASRQETGTPTSDEAITLQLAVIAIALHSLP
jgi:hypothetical protein